MVQALGALLRWRLALAVGGTTLVGGGLVAPLSEAVFSLAPWGVVCLTAAGSALNQLLERREDAQMRRTRLRPLVQGALTPRVVLILALPLLLVGAALLWQSGSAVVLLALATLLWYLGLYTPLKRRTPLALLLGTPCGAVPPLLGVMALGGDPTTPPALVFALFLLFWQLPHGWLLLLRHAGDYRAAGFVTLAASLRQELVSPLLALWLPALALAPLALMLVGGVTPGLQGALLVGLPLWLLFAFWGVRRRPSDQGRALALALHLLLLAVCAALLWSPTPPLQLAGKNLVNVLG